MNINKKLTELIEGVYNGDIDTLSELQRELIYLRSGIQALRIHDVVGRSEQLHKLLQHLSDEDELIHNRTHQQIIDDFNRLV